MTKLIIAAAIVAATTVVAEAQDIDPKSRAENGMKPSEILATVESRDDFRYLEEMSWDDDGYYAIVYHTADSARVEINIDALSGEPVEPD